MPLRGTTDDENVVVSSRLPLALARERDVGAADVRAAQRSGVRGFRGSVATRGTLRAPAATFLAGRGGRAPCAMLDQQIGGARRHDLSPRRALLRCARPTPPRAL